MPFLLPLVLALGWQLGERSLVNRCDYTLVLTFTQSCLPSRAERSARVTRAEGRTVAIGESFVIVQIREIIPIFEPLPHRAE